MGTMLGNRGFGWGKMEENGDFRGKNAQKGYKTGYTSLQSPMNNGGKC